MSLLPHLDASEPDTRWLALEAYLLRGNGLSQAAIRKLLAEDEEYARVAAVDVLLRFEDDVFPTLVQAMGDLNTYSVAGAQSAYLLTQSESLRRKVLAAIVAETGKFVRCHDRCCVPGRGDGGRLARRIPHPGAAGGRGGSDG